MTATGAGRRSAPAALRNREPIAEVLSGWLPGSGTVLEIASGSGEHAVYFARRFGALTWQPTDANPAALCSIAAWRDEAALPNLEAPIQLDAGGNWSELRANAILCINMAHISPWEATLGLLANAQRLLAAGGALIFYGPWLADDVPTARSNLEFDSQLQGRNPDWGIRSVGSLEAAASNRGFSLVERRPMPANNFMLLLRRNPLLR